MDSPEFLEGRPRARGVDQGFTEAINQKMQVPERLSVGVGPGDEKPEKLEDLTLAYRMHVPDRLSLAAMDLNPRPFFSTSFKHSAPPHVGLAWDVQSAGWDRSTSSRDPPVSPLRRSFSDQTINWSPPVTPSASKQILHTPPICSTGHPPQCPGPSTIPPSLLTPQHMLQAAKDLGRLASRRVLQSVTQKYSARSSCPENPPTALTDIPSTTGLSRRSTTMEWLEDDGGDNVEFLVLRRQVPEPSGIPGPTWQNGRGFGVRWSSGCNQDVSPAPPGGENEPAAGRPGAAERGASAERAAAVLPADFRLSAQRLALAAKIAAHNCATALGSQIRTRRRQKSGR
ncbi:mitochondrial fission factor-like isoform X2 [Brienomyrus brachyistius]|uniref:mitochondrial fission factor-like isoform X2 n=1 Tax=Brienomyrus brachyistius TaxID=42636 RepID=UPI0020B36B34|nr:mitochondrial fission factor-like isoform X2 [Brienomyrus brachyistius]